MGLVLFSVDVLKKTVVDKLPNDLEGLEGTIERLQDMIETVSRYVDDVIVSS
jgi:translation initiation factor 3 subunit F